MYYPHREAKTGNLDNSYKENLESEALKSLTCEYEKEAIKFLLDTGTGLEVIKTGTKDTEHGKVDVYTISIFKLYSQQETLMLTDGFHNSVYATEKKEFLTAYSVLAYFSTYAFQEFLEIDEVVETYGDMKPSQAIAIFEEANSVNKIFRTLFSSEQLERLSEIS